MYSFTTEADQTSHNCLICSTSTWFQVFPGFWFLVQWGWKFRVIFGGKSFSSSLKRVAPFLRIEKADSNFLPRSHFLFFADSWNKGLFSWCKGCWERCLHTELLLSASARPLSRNQSRVTEQRNLEDHLVCLVNAVSFDVYGTVSMEIRRLLRRVGFIWHDCQLVCLLQSGLKPPKQTWSETWRGNLGGLIENESSEFI